ncbi:MAG: 2-C-methyl-D-erythritol 4-phosphate cytidylyltransferase [Chloroflexi bacterium]|nr:2-C-methyl-D-erythritol 4-phosphate cytidylyltransferase [Chloroflexota bacterium]
MGGTDKVFAPLIGSPLILHTLRPFCESPSVHFIVLLLGQHNLEKGKQLVRERGLTKVVAVTLGGQRRQDTVRLGLDALPSCRWVLVHDGARPCLDPSLIDQALAAAQDTGAAAAGVPVKDTIKLVDPSLHVLETPPREALWAIQTPQAFRREVLEEAHRRIQKDATDDASMVEQLGYRVKVFTGSYTNLKVTTPEDLWLAEAILRRRSSAPKP